MDLFCFASRNEHNIHLGVEAGKWAVARVSNPAMRGRTTKARRYFGPNACGLIYCSPNHSFTTPFIALSVADPDGVVMDIWPVCWVLPFSMRPLGGPHRQLSGEQAVARWPFLSQRLGPRGGVTAAMNANGATVFSPVPINQDDWNLNSC